MNGNNRIEENDVLNLQNVIKFEKIIKPLMKFLNKNKEKEK